jgi:hypothetical protein
MGSREIAMVAAQKANPPAIASIIAFIQIDLLIFLSPSFLLFIGFFISGS